MGVTYTDEQTQVINLRNRNILVSAAAGSGKTAVLVERIIARLTRDENPLNIDELLIVTYTEAAAAEMKERIQNAIEKALDEEPDNVHLQKQSTLIHQARITTIHGFCLSVIRDYFHVIDLDPAFRIAEEGELKLLKRDVAEEILEQKYEEADPIFLGFVESYASGKDDKNLEDIMLQLFEFSRSYPDQKKWLEMCVEQYDIDTLEDFENSFFVRDVLEEVRMLLKEWQEELDYGIQICQSEDGPAVYQETLLLDKEVLLELENAHNFEAMQLAFANVKWSRLVSNRDKTVDENKMAQVQGIRAELKDKIKKLKEQYFFDSAEEMQKDLYAAKNNMQMLAQLVVEFAETFTQKKRSKNMIDFGDMERYALDILTEETEAGTVPSGAAKELQEKFAEIMIDEYQDSNLIQEAILTSVSRVDSNIFNIFMVGDVKQSIYRFRLSRPELFMEKFHTYSLDESEKQRIDLFMNFRSRKEVLESTNFVFEQLMTEKFGGITYDHRSALYPGADYDETLGNEAEFFLVDGEDLKSREQMEVEALVIAQRIQELVGEYKVKDKKTNTYRPAEYGDIVVLMRSLQGWSDMLTETLSAQGIPTRITSKESYFQTREIKLLLDYLRVLDNPRQDIPLAAVLLSMFGKMTNEELALVRGTQGKKGLYECICCYAEMGTDQGVQVKLVEFLEQLNQFRKRVPYTAIHELLWEILEETGYGDYAAAMPGGAQRAANIEMLVQKAIAFETTSYKGLFSFVRYIEQLHKYDVDYGEASLGEESSNAVKLMSIHKSKGLEFPIVIAAGMGKQFNMQDSRSSIAIHPQCGIGLDRIDAELRTKCPTLLKRVIQRKILLENAAEELRVLYVAMTRAREKLILVGTAKNLEDYIRKFSKVERCNSTELPYDDVTGAGRYLDWLVLSLYRNRCFADVLNQLDFEVPFSNPMFRREVPFSVKMVNMSELLESEADKTIHSNISKHILKNWDTAYVYDEIMKRNLEQQLSYLYPYQDFGMKQKMSVSELKKRAYEEESGDEFFKEEEVFPLLPKFIQEKSEFTGALRGTAYHRVLELLDFTKVYTEAGLKESIKQFVREGFIEEEMSTCIDPKDILKFLESPAGLRIREASKCGKYHAEQPFVLGVSAKEVYAAADEDETVLVQGIIDVYFEEDGELVVLDYKTDRVQRAEELTERYRAQLDYYGRALERLTGKNVKEKIIYSFTLQKEIKL